MYQLIIDFMGDIPVSGSEFCLYLVAFVMLFYFFIDVITFFIHIFKR